MNWFLITAISLSSPRLAAAFGALLLAVAGGCSPTPRLTWMDQLESLGVRLYVRESRNGEDRFSIEIGKQEQLPLALELIKAHCRPIDRLACRGLEMGPAEFRVIGQLSELRQLDLYGVAIGESAGEIAGLANLQSLNLAHQANGDEQLRLLASLQNLTSLAVGGNTTDGGLVHLSKMAHLRTLFLGDSQITGEGLHFIPASQLQTLYLDRTTFGDDHSEQLSAFRNLQRLGLAGTRITDSGLNALKPLQQLDYLSIEDTQIGDASIELISSLAKLYVVDVAGSQVSPAGIILLQGKRPNMLIGNDNQAPATPPTQDVTSRSDASRLR